MTVRALGMIESVGMAATVAAADAAVKSAHVTIIGYELTKGNGMVMIKFAGNVGAVKAALEAATVAAEKVGKVVSKHFIPRPHDDLEKLINNEETISTVYPSNVKNDSSLMGRQEQDEKNSVEADASSEETNNEIVENVSDVETDSSHDVGNETEELEEETLVEQDGISTLDTVKEQADDQEDCNVCKDPKCPRRKGEKRSTCINYEK